MYRYGYRIGLSPPSALADRHVVVAGGDPLEEQVSSTDLDLGLDADCFPGACDELERLRSSVGLLVAISTTN